MRILLIHNYYQNYGGEDTYFDLLASLLTSHGHTVTKFTKYSNEIGKTLKEQIGLSINLITGEKIVNELIHLINTTQPEVVHINNIFPLFTPIVFTICKQYKIPIVHTIHTYRYVCPKGTLFRNGKLCELCVDKNIAYPSIYHRCYHRSSMASFILNLSMKYHNVHHLLRSMDKIIFPATFAQNYYVKHLHLQKQKTCVVPNFVHSPKKQNTKKKNYFIFIGRFSDEKGIITLLKVFSDLPTINLVAIGNGPLLSKVLAFTRYKNIKIKINASTKEVLTYLSQAKCTIIPSPVHYEFGPLVLMESFAAGTPVLVPKGGVFLERVLEKKTGFFYTPNELNLAEAIINIHESRIGPSYSRNTYKDYKEKYTPEIHYKNLLKIYESVC